MSQKFEATFDEFIKELGGKRIPPVSTQGQMRADYIFRRSANLSIDVILELKSLEEEGYDLYLAKAQAMASEWIKTGRLIVVGQVAVNYRDLSQNSEATGTIYSSRSRRIWFGRRTDRSRKQKPT